MKITGGTPHIALGMRRGGGGRKDDEMKSNQLWDYLTIVIVFFFK